jgi:hypothetical protein
MDFLDRVREVVGITLKVEGGSPADAEGVIEQGLE